MTTVATEVLRLQGVLTFSNAAAVLQAQRQVLATATVRTIDLAAVTDCDSAGLACVLALLAEAQQRLGAEVQLQHAPEGLQALAEVAGLGRLFH